MLDVVIVGGMIVDGTGGSAKKADVGIAGDRIEVVGNLSGVDARRIIRASGLTVSPGFIDTHTHSDGALLWDPQHANAIKQGVTTEILGQDGLSFAPLSPENYKAFGHYLAGILGSPSEGLDVSSVRSFRSHYDKKVAVNTAYNIPHGAIRLETLGFEDTPLRGEAMDRALDLVRQGMEEGAVGFSTGLSYHPNAWGDTYELIAICRVIAEYGGVFSIHLRDVNTDRAFGQGGVAEALEVGRRSGVKVHFSHYRTDASTAGQVRQRMELIDQAKAEGVDCTLELYPYPTGSTFPLSFIPSEFHRGGLESLIPRLSVARVREQILGEFESSPRRTLSDVVFTYARNNKELEGASLADVADERNSSLGETLIDLLIEENGQLCYRGAPPDNVRIWDQINKDTMELLSRPDYMVGSDAIPIGSMPHPRAYGCFPRFLGRLRSRYPVMGLEQAVQRITDNPARRFGLKDRGLVKEGYFADIAVFDEEQIIDNATYDDPTQFPTGIPYVLVNGQLAVDSERCTGVMAGRAIP